MSLPQIEFSPEVLSRIAPEVFLQRHLDLGLRPNLRKFDEFATVAVTTGTLTSIPDRIVGSSTVKSGSTTVITTVSLALVEIDGSEQDEYTTVYPVVDVMRGRQGAPTDEEMILSQSLHEAIYHSRVLSRKALQVENLGLSVADEDGVLSIYYPDLNPEEYSLLSAHPKRYSYVLTANIKVFSKQTSTSSLFDLCYTSISTALAATQLPRVYVSDSASIAKVVRSRMTTKRGVVSNSSGQLNLDTNSQLYHQLEANNTGTASNYGVVNHKEKLVILSDLAGEAEEATVTTRVSVISDGDRLKKVTAIAGDSSAGISMDVLQQIIESAKQR